MRYERTNEASLDCRSGQSQHTFVEGATESTTDLLYDETVQVEGLVVDSLVGNLDGDAQLVRGRGDLVERQHLGVHFVQLLTYRYLDAVIEHRPLDLAAHASLNLQTDLAVDQLSLQRLDEFLDGHRNACALHVGLLTRLDDAGGDGAGSGTLQQEVTVQLALADCFDDLTHLCVHVHRLGVLGRLALLVEQSDLTLVALPFTGELSVFCLLLLIQLTTFEAVELGVNLRLAIHELF